MPKFKRNLLLWKYFFFTPEHIKHHHRNYKRRLAFAVSEDDSFAAERFLVVFKITIFFTSTVTE